MSGDEGDEDESERNGVTIASYLLGIELSHLTLK